MHMRLMTIGQLAGQAKVTPRAIRHYEHLGLINAPVRTDANYRLFDSDSVSRIKFISKCRALGLSLSEIANFLRILEDPDHTCAQVTKITRQHLDLVDSKISDLVEMRRTLALNLARCTGTEVPDCPVLDFLQRST
jgi:MerR family transcriptional regulator, mercuric resistance operon regulatory protein